MRRWLSIHGESRVTHTVGAPKRIRRNCGTDSDQVCIGRARRSNIASEIILAIHERQAGLLAVSFRGVSVSLATMGSWVVIGCSLTAWAPTIVKATRASGMTPVHMASEQRKSYCTL